MSNYEGNERKHMPKHFEYLILNTSDTTGLGFHFHGASHFIKEGRSRGGGVLVHCSHPQSALSVAAVLAYLMNFQRLDYQKASALVHESFPFSLPQELVVQLLEYQANSLHVVSADATRADEQLSKANQEDISIRHERTPTQKREHTPARVLAESYEENRRPALQDEMLDRAARESAKQGTVPSLPMAVQSYWTRSSPQPQPKTGNLPPSNPGADGGVKAMDISDYASRTYDLQQQQHALLTATGQVSAVCERCVSSDANATLSGRFGL